jgi:hypothetical protein
VGAARLLPEGNSEELFQDSRRRNFASEIDADMDRLDVILRNMTVNQNLNPHFNTIRFDEMMAGRPIPPRGPIERPDSPPPLGNEGFRGPSPEPQENREEEAEQQIDASVIDLPQVPEVSPEALQEALNPIDFGNPGEAEIRLAARFATLRLISRGAVLAGLRVRSSIGLSIQECEETAQMAQTLLLRLRETLRMAMDHRFSRTLVIGITAISGGFFFFYSLYTGRGPVGTIWGILAHVGPGTGGVNLSGLLTDGAANRIAAVGQQVVTQPMGTQMEGLLESIFSSGGSVLVGVLSFGLGVATRGRFGFRRPR